jgi:small ligand-binding sensory domain FIST
VAVGDVIEVGRTVRFQVRDAGSAAEDLRAALPAADPAQPSGALLFSCKARRSLFARPDHEAHVVRDRLGGGAVAGLLAAGEIGPVGGRNHLHGNSTAVLALG